MQVARFPRRPVAALLVLSGLGLFRPADAAELVAAEDLDPTSVELARQAAGATGPVLDATALVALPLDVSAEDEAAWAALRQTLSDVRAYETRLDGELLIMQELDRALARVGLVRGPDDVELLFQALAYQGFAVQRYFEDDLASDERAAPYRATVDGAVQPRPWLDAIALAPGRDVTPYDIAEAPARVAYNQLRASRSNALPGLLVPGALPTGARVLVDGAPVTPDASGSLKVHPGRHYVHVTLGEHVLARQTLRVGSTESVTLTPPVDAAPVQAWLDAMSSPSEAPTEPPPAVRAAAEQLGGLWVAGLPTKGGLSVVVVDGGGVRRELIPTSSAPDAPTRDGGWSLALGVGGGWMLNDAWYLQDPVNAPRTVGTVNSAAVTVSAGADIDKGPLRVGAGLDLALTPGAAHVSAYGDSGSTRVHAVPHLRVGVPLVQVGVGFLTPFHPAGGLRVAVPVGPVELQGVAWAGVPLTWTRDDGSEWKPGRAGTAAVQVAWRGPSR